jgi:hypothetical protein
MTETRYRHRRIGYFDFSVFFGISANLNILASRLYVGMEFDILGIGIWNLFVIWDLVLGIYSVSIIVYL